MPKQTPAVCRPAVRREVVRTTHETASEIPVVVKKRLGHAGIWAYAQAAVDIQLTLTTQANASKPVPVVMELSFKFRPVQRPGGAPAATRRARTALRSTTLRAAISGGSSRYHFIRSSSSMESAEWGLSNRKPCTYSLPMSLSADNCR